MGQKTIELKFTRPREGLIFNHHGKYGSASMCLYGIKQYFDISLRDYELTFTIHGSQPPGQRWHRMSRSFGGWFLDDVETYFELSMNYNRYSLPESIDKIIDRAFPKRRNLYVSLTA